MLARALASSAGPSTLQVGVPAFVVRTLAFPAPVHVRFKSDVAAPKTVVIVGGVAAGASCAARLRRQDESSHIILAEKGPFVSFANCGLPYYVGDVIKHRQDLIVATPELFLDRYRVDVRLNTEAVDIQTQNKVVTLLRRANPTAAPQEEEVKYDSLVLATGARSMMPPIPGIDLEGIFVVRTIPDSVRIREFIAHNNAKRAVVVGAGFVGIEMAENLHGRGLDVTVVELSSQIMSAFDFEITQPMRVAMEKKGVKVILQDGVEKFEQQDKEKVNSPLRVTTHGGQTIEGDIVILAIGVTPNSELAEKAGLKLGMRKAIAVDSQMRTSDPNIWAVGDVCQTIHAVTGKHTHLPLAGPANRQGRVAADAIAGKPSRFRGVQDTAVCGAFGVTLAMTGCGVTTLRRSGIEDFVSVRLHPGQHVSYYPGEHKLHMKVIFDSKTGRLLGGQAVGSSGILERINALAVAIQMKATVHDLAEVELCYAPQFGAAKDPLNMAGFIGANYMNGELPIARWGDFLKEYNTEPAQRPGPLNILDVRLEWEYEEDGLKGSINIPVEKLREQLDKGQVPDDLVNGAPIHVLCAAGQRAYYAVRMLRAHKLDGVLLPGGMITYHMLCDSRDILELPYSKAQLIAGIERWEKTHQPQSKL